MIASVFIVFVVSLALGIPIAVSLGFTVLSAAFFVPSLPADSVYAFRSMVTALDSYSLLAIPLFILSGNIMAKGGISRKLFDFFSYFIGNRTAGLPIAAIITCLFYGAISGSGPATVAAVGSMTIPLLVELGYDKKFSVAMIAVAGGLGVIIPPSIPFIVYGQSSGASVGDLFIAGVLPGMLIALCMIVYAYFYCKFKGEDKEKLLANTQQLRSRGFMVMLKDSFWSLLTPVIILGGIYSGIVTPTEAANISVVYALIISLFIYKSLKFKDLSTVMKETVNTAAPILLVVSIATVFGKVLTFMQAPQLISAAITGTFTTKVSVLLVINVILLFVGMVMDTTPAILILTPIFMPIIQAIGVNPLHFGIIMVVNLAIGFVTPPIGINLFVASSLTGISVMDIAKRAIPFIIAFFIALLFITFVPEISLMLIGK
ncbi:C4-dicarboxylate transporter DctM subunit [Sedimentibacter acidaminivorans]|uniref:C4-dicarboxylate transporter DctM subunit n=1 Tax=Sedimentibacter acidaminivorans TaxID=913099 RepID=A0ABS4GFH3_9FIRM|nr:TRAP transporter large permease [Sedimentibacter acidaminivorans]MBP1926429.1 C4-dicarboxylate transporter DctM subunit [Sedimentibacter acidaminivorans]